MNYRSPGNHRQNSKSSPRNPNNHNNSNDDTNNNTIIVNNDNDNNSIGIKHTTTYYYILLHTTTYYYILLHILPMVTSSYIFRSRRGRPERRPRENMVGVNMVLAEYPQSTLYHRICIVHV